jgi:hypothetical protein
VRRREVGVTCGAEATRWREEAEAGQREGAEAARWATTRSSDGKFPLGGAKGLILSHTAARAVALSYAARLRCMTVQGRGSGAVAWGIGNG